MPVALPWFTSRMNYRNHRKIAVIDGRIGFTGGINIAERYLNGTRFGPWRDTHLLIEGDAVNMLQALFTTDWHFVSGRQELTGDKYFPKTKIRTKSPIQIASSGPDSNWASIMQAYFAAINKARKSIYITSPYFMPNQSILTALKVAALSGIDVRIILPYRSDSKLVYWASRSYIGELLDAGIKVYFYCRGFNHSKFIIIDNVFCSVGSANMDYRSFEDNFEVSAVMYDPRIAATLTQYFMQDIGNSVLITPDAWHNRSNLHAAYESLARLFSPLL
jgi:cardiolipin synthase